MNALVLTRPVRLLQPKCHVIVSKNGGCHDIGCSCGAHFCWLCGREDCTGNCSGNPEGGDFDDSESDWEEDIGRGHLRNFAPRAPPPPPPPPNFPPPPLAPAPTPSPVRAQPHRHARCRRCNRFGHLARDCTTPRGARRPGGPTPRTWAQAAAAGGGSGMPVNSDGGLAFAPATEPAANADDGEDSLRRGI